jgi:lipopolysaccharide transport system ATP-binding protein
MSDTVIAAEKVTKRYLIGQAEQRHETLIGSAISALMSPIRNARRLARLDASRVAADATDILWALDGVSFEVKRGEVLGIIGRNGAGKSTLLKILSRITEPTSGWVGIKGRVASLLEVGTGFHPELTGRDNVYLNGTLLGMTKREIDRKFDEIVDFSGVERFLDTPVKRYSSGMSVRLAFAVAAHLEPDILIVDEVLAVGDYEFQKKCMKKMEDVSAGNGRTILFVSHNISAISSLTTKCVYLKNGRIQCQGPTEDIVPVYLGSGHASDARWTTQGQTDKPFQFLSAEIRNPDGELTSNLDNLEDIRVSVEYEVREELRGAVVAAILHARDGALLFSTEDTDTQTHLMDCRFPGRYRSSVTIPGGLLNEGDFYIRIGAGIPGQVTYENIEALSFSLHNTKDHHTRGHRKAAYFLPTFDWRVESDQLQEEVSSPK